MGRRAANVEVSRIDPEAAHFAEVGESTPSRRRFGEAERFTDSHLELEKGSFGVIPSSIFDILRERCFLLSHQSLQGRT